MFEANIWNQVMEWGLHRELGINGSCIDSVSFPPEDIGVMLPSSLTHLATSNFKNLRKLSSNGFQNRTSLQSLSIFNCPKLKSLPAKNMLTSLFELHIYINIYIYIFFCSVLTKRCKKNKGKQWSNIAHIPCACVRIDGQFIYMWMMLGKTRGRTSQLCQLGITVFR